MAELSDLVRQGQRFVFDELGLGEEQLTLIGKLDWLKADGKVESMKYDSEARNIYVTFRGMLSVSEFEKLTRKYEIDEPDATEYGEHNTVRVSPWGRGQESLNIYFIPVDC